MSICGPKCLGICCQIDRRALLIGRYSGVIRAVDPATHIHPQYNVEVTIEPEDEMSKFVLLSLHGVPKPPKKEQHAEKRADAWYARFLSGEEGLKHVAINDEMQGGTNLTVRLSFPPPWISFVVIFCLLVLTIRGSKLTRLTKGSLD